MSTKGQIEGGRGEEVDAEVETVIAAFDGDMRAAIRSLLIANEFLMEEIDRLRASPSVGYVRGRGNVDRGMR